MGVLANDLKKSDEIVLSMSLKERSGFKKDLSLKLIKDWVNAEYHYFKWCGNKSKEELSEDLNKYYIKKSYFEYIFRTLKEIKTALKKGKLVLSHKGGLSWDVHYLKNNEVRGVSLIFKKFLCNYSLNYNTGYYCISCYGTSRPLEIIMNYGYKLGLKFSEINQQQTTI